jgi:Cu-processing system permease protein
VALTFVFTALSYYISVKNEERVKGVGLTILVWLFLAVIYDGIILALIFAFGDYPLDKASIAITLLNPIDLARIMMLLTVDISALLGYTGAVFKQFFGSPMGLLVTISSLVIWTLIPLWRGQVLFERKDL